MIGLLIVLVLQALLLRVAIGLVGGVEAEDNTFGRAFIVAAVLAGVSGVLGALHLPGLIGAIAWLFVVKTAYDAGWGRAIVVWIALVLVSLVVASLLAMLGLVALGMFVLVI